jgi:hypothetical protein
MYIVSGFGVPPFLNMGDLLLKGHIDREHYDLSADGMG